MGTFPKPRPGARRWPRTLARASTFGLVRPVGALRLANGTRITYADPKSGGDVVGAVVRSTTSPGRVTIRLSTGRKVNVTVARLMR